MGEVTAEVHGEICEVFKYDDIMLVGDSGYALQLFLVEADPGGIVRIRVHDGGYTS